MYVYKRIDFYMPDSADFLMLKQIKGYIPIELVNGAA